MNERQDHHKVRAEHLARQAFIYVRQSTLTQVKRNVGSTMRQYDFAQQACALGWSPEQLVIIDHDQAQSGTTSAERAGFQSLIAEVGLGHAGAVLSLEASRLARTSSDWAHLLEICALTDTLVIDEEGIYDPGQHNDRLLMGFKGTMSEAELHWIRNRLLGGKLALARQGKLQFHLPTGLIHDIDGSIIKDPDEAIQAGIQQVFDCFEELKTAHAVMRYFRDHHLLIPTRLWGTANAGECVWRPLSVGRVLATLHNPLYAGAYVYGRTQIVREVQPPARIVTRQVKRDVWEVIIQDTHPGYITWAQFQRNQQRLDDNRNSLDPPRRGVVREGVGLLQGIVMCGRCGRRMKVSYQEDKIKPMYLCDVLYKRFGGSWCQAIRGHRVDEAIAQIVLEAVQPAQVEAVFEALDHLERHAQQLERQHDLRLERAQYEADLARRRFMAVEPENRLVARTLERDWNEKLTFLDELQRVQDSMSKEAVQRITPEERQQICQLIEDFPALWQAETTTHAERKQLLRLLIKDVTLLGQETTVQIGIRWRSGATTELQVPRGTQRTSQHIIDRIRQLADEQYSDAQIAEMLNQAGLTTARCLSFTASRVKELRGLYHITRGDSKRPDRYPTGQRADGRYTVRKTSELLNWSISTINKWCRNGCLDAVQEGPGCPYWIRLTPEIIAQLRNPTNPWDPNV